MSGYVQTTFFGPKDALPTTDPNKTIFGAAYDIEFGNIATAINSKLDTVGGSVTGAITLSGNRTYAGASNASNSYLFLNGVTITGVASVGIDGIISPLHFYFAGDSVDTTTSGSSLLRYLSINAGVSAGHTGGRSAIYGAVQVVGAPTVPPSGTIPGYVGGEFFGFVNINTFGTAGVFTNYLGTVYGINPTARVGPLGTFLAVANPCEFNVGIQYGGSVATKFGLSVIKQSLDTAQGVYNDCAMTIIDQAGYANNIPATGMVAGKSYKIVTVGTTDYTLVGSPNNTIGQFFGATGAGTGTGTVSSEMPPWNFGLSFGGYSSQWAFDATSTLITAQQRIAGIPGTMTAAAMQANGGYKIASVGTTDYTLVGSPNNTVGTVFIATGPATGTGTVTRGQDVANIGVDFTAVLFKTAAFQSTGFVVGPSGITTISAAAYTPTVSLAFGATPTINTALSNMFEIGALTGNITTLTLQGTRGGQTITIRFIQDGVGGRTVATPAGAKITGSVTLTASTASFLTLTYSTASARWEGSYLGLPT